MYTEQDYQDICAQCRRRQLAVWLPTAALAAAVIVSFALRIQWLTVALTLLAGLYAIFCWGLFAAPVRAYRRHLDEVLHGRVRTATGTLKCLEEEAVIRDGVWYYPMTLSVGNPDDPEDDRLFYYDASLPRPDWQPGDALTVTAHDKALGAWERVREETE